MGQPERRVLVECTTRTRELDAIASAVNGLSRGLAEQEALRRRLTADMARPSGLHEEILRLGRMVSDIESLSRLESGGRDGETPACIDADRISQAVVNLSLQCPALHSRGRLRRPCAPLR